MDATSSDSVGSAAIDDQTPSASSPTDTSLAVHDPEPLTTQQQIAIEHMTAGKSMSESAQVAGVSRSTLYRWLKDDAHFRAAFEAWKEQARVSASGRLVAMTDLAVDALQHSLNKGNAQAALAVLKGMGYLTAPNARRDQSSPAQPNAAEGRSNSDRKKSRLAHHPEMDWLDLWMPNDDGPFAPMQLVSTGCAENGLPEFELNWTNPAISIAQAREFAEWLETIVASGHPFTPERFINIGWIEIRVRELPNGRLCVMEPDFREAKGEYISSVDNTMLHYRLEPQIYNSVEVGRSSDVPSMGGKLTVFGNGDYRESCLMIREEPDDGISGWTIYRGKERNRWEGDEIRSMTMFEAAVEMPRLIHFFTLPPGTEVEIEAETGITIRYQGRELPFVAGTLLDQMRKIGRA